MTPSSPSAEGHALTTASGLGPTPSAPATRLRPMRDSDMDFLYRLYASTRREELAVTGWADEQKDAFLRMQFHAQHTHYQRYYGNASFDIILDENIPVGRLYVDRTPEEVHIVDISVLPEYRGRGIGSRLIRELQESCAASGRVLGIQVEKLNPARNLYQRLGFSTKADEGVYLYQEWSAT